MGASKRSNYSANNRGNAGAEAARNLGVVLGLGGLSFFLGFFVLSRMVPDKHDTSGLAAASAATTHDAPIAPPQTSSAPSVPAHNEAATSDSSSTVRPADKGPVLEQASEPATQPSGSVEHAAKPTMPDGANSVETGDSSGAASIAGSSAANTTSAGGAPSETNSAVPKTPHMRRHVGSAPLDAASPSGDKTDTGSISQEDQKPSRIDREASGDTPARSERHASAGSTGSRSDRADSTGDESSPPPKTVKRVRYSVRGSAYSRREAAERESRRITDLGLDATVVPITSEDGTTVYRVQQGVYRNRSNAEKAKSKLSDAGVEAEIVKTQADTR